MTASPTRRPLAPWLCLILAVACGDSTAGDGGTTAGSGTTSQPATSSSSGQPGSTTASPDPDTTAGTGSASGGGSSSSSGSTTAADSTGPAGSSSSSGGDRRQNGCSDAEREALTDEAAFPDIAGCAGGFSERGVFAGAPMCNREGGDDGINATGMGCNVEDLCSEGWHLCLSATEVSDAGVADCNQEGFSGSFFLTAQSGMGKDTCANTGTNDVFGCGDIGHTMIVGCSPLNRSGANLCEALPDPWECDISAGEEAQFVRKLAPQFGGALCCRD